MSGTTTEAKRNVISMTGGKVHNPHPGFGEGDDSPWPHCRSYGGNAVRSRFTFTTLEVTCTRCAEQNRRHEAAVAARLEREAAEAAAELEAAQVVEVVEVVAAAPAPAVAIASAAHTARYAAPIVEADRLYVETIAGTERAEIRLEFPDMADRGRHRRAAAERLARAFGVEVTRKILIDDDWAGRDPYGPAPWAYGPRELTIKGRPSLVARFVLALTPILIDLEYVATVAAKEYGKWLRTSPLADLEMMPAAHRAAMRGWRREVFDEASYIAGYSVTAGRLFFPRNSWSSQARAYAYTLPALPDLWSYADEAAVAELVAGAHHIVPPVIAEPTAAEARAARRFAALEALDAPVWEFGPMPVDPEYVAPTIGYAHPDFGTLDEAEPLEVEASIDVEALAVEVDAEASLLAELAAVVEAAADQLAPRNLVDIVNEVARPALPTARKDAPLDRRPARRPHAPRPARRLGGARPLGGGRGPAGGRPGGGPALGEVRVLRGRAGRAGGAGAAHGARRGGLAPRAGGDARALGGRRGGVLGAHPGAVRPAAVLAGRQARRGMVLAV